MGKGRFRTQTLFSPQVHLSLLLVCLSIQPNLTSKEIQFFGQNAILYYTLLLYGQMYLKENGPPPLELKSVRPAGRPLFITGDPTCGIFLKRGLFRDTNYDVHMSQTRKYKNTNTQIRKYTNTASDKVPQRPNMWYIFEKRIDQGYQL